MTKEKSTVPRLRFPGFTDAWKQRKLGEVVDVCSGRDYKHLEAGSVPVYGTGGYMLSVSEALSENVDAIGIGRKGTIDNPYILKAPFWTVDTLFYCLPKQGSILEFSYTIFQNINWRSMDESTGVPSLSKVRINNIKVLTPSLQEQEAIGSFFSDLDQLITLHQRKLDDVKELKKALLQKMFPKGNGNDFPELRFPEFKDAWKQRKLGEVADFSIKTNSLSRDKLSSYFYEVQNIHYGDILTKYDAILDVCNKELPSIIGSTISDFADDLLIEGDIVFADAAEDSTVGKAIEVRNFKGKNVVSGLHTIVARPKVSYAPYYLGYLINSTAYHNQILPLMQGTKVSSISKANLKSTTIVFPTLPEQEAIGSFFSDLDQLITLHQRQLDHLKLLKKALLQQMFI
ncbi:TPA: restriction endonuclease subunit S [Streptococcus suis]|nr:restriction endonuclease subunit S [Streptococcus suis]